MTWQKFQPPTRMKQKGQGAQIHATLPSGTDAEVFNTAMDLVRQKTGIEPQIGEVIRAALRCYVRTLKNGGKPDD